MQNPLASRSPTQSRQSPLAGLVPALLTLLGAFGALQTRLSAQAVEPVVGLPAEAPAAMAEIRAKDLMAHATYLASDELGGRLTGSPGQEAAARYIAEHFAQLGLAPLGDPDEDGKPTWFQRYGITRTAIDPATRIRCGEIDAASGFAILGGEPVDVTFEGALRFVGLGRTRGSQADIDADVSLEGAVPVVLVRGPRGRLDRKLSVEEKFGLSMSTFGNLGRTARNLERRGAKAAVFLMVEDPLGLADVLNYVGLSPGKDLLVPRFRGADAGMAGMARMFGGDSPIPVVVATPDLSAQLLEVLAVDRDAVLAWLQGDGEPVRSDSLPAAQLRLLVERDEQATACNVVACLRGSDATLRDTALVYSAHMDHIGRRMDDEVFNGADDNASGSAGLLGIATAFAKSAEKPRRSVVFLSVSGEELGLWGSAYFADNPTWPLDKIVANINTDMIGRSGPESGPLEVTVTPSNRHRMFSTIVQDAAGFAEELGMSFTNGDKYYQRSDHYNFVKKGVPAVFFCNGEHEDYHQVSDHADKLDAAKMERIARLAFWTGWSVADHDDPPRTLGPREDWR